MEAVSDDTRIEDQRIVCLSLRLLCASPQALSSPCESAPMPCSLGASCFCLFLLLRFWSVRFTPAVEIERRNMSILSRFCRHRFPELPKQALTESDCLPFCDCGFSPQTQTHVFLFLKNDTRVITPHHAPNTPL